MKAPAVGPELVTAIEETLEKRGSRREGRELRFRCPRPDHADEHPSARWNGTKATWWCPVCKVGGGARDLVKLLKLRIRFDAGMRPKIAAEYEYLDEKWKRLFVVERLDPKGFRQWRPGAHRQRLYQLGNVRRVLFRLPHLLKADPANVVFVVEGEKDVLELIQRGLVATCNPGGAGSWRDEYGEALRGRHVAVLADNDEAGRDHARDVARRICRTAAGVKLIELPGLAAKGDISDWLEAGGTPEQLREIVAATREWNDTDRAGASSVGEDAPGDESGDQPNPGDKHAVLRCIADVKPEQIDWLWSGMIPRGKLSLLVGEPGVGKSFLSLAVAGALSCGARLPGDESDRNPCDVVLLSAEDAPGDTIRPRLEAMGADLARIHFFDHVVDEHGDRPLTLGADLDVLDRIVVEKHVGLVMIDPVQAYLAGVDIHRTNEVRAVLAPLAKLAERRHVAVVAIMHLNKMASTSVSSRVNGSVDFVGAARSVLVVGRDPADARRAIVARGKSNLPGQPDPQGFEIVNGAVCFTGPAQEVGVAELLSGAGTDHDRSALEEATRFLLEELREGEVEANTVNAHARALAISSSTLKRAKKEIGVKSRKTSSGWFWFLPNGSAQDSGWTEFGAEGEA
jgi:hypothetical protein